MNSPIFLRTENQLNKTLRTQKRTGEKVSILFVSLWDEHSQKVTELLKQKLYKHKVYVVDSFTMPHAFVIFKTTHLPHIVTLSRGIVQSEDYLPHVYKELGL